MHKNLIYFLLPKVISTIPNRKIASKLTLLKSRRFQAAGAYLVPAFPAPDSADGMEELS
jgi:hypothetical protein